MQPSHFVVAQLGARRHYAVPRILFRAGLLDALYTDISCAKGWPRILTSLPRPALPKTVKHLLGRVPDGIPASHIRHFPAFGLEYARRRFNAKSPTEVTAVHLWAGETLCRKAIQRGLGGASAVYGFNSACLELLEFANREGRLGVVEQTSAPTEIEEELVGREKERFPGWAPSARNLLSADYAGRVRAEWDTASLILCGSQFVKDGINAVGGPLQKCVVIPYGGTFSFPNVRDSRRNAPLRALFVGRVCLQKGVPYLLQAAAKFAVRDLHLRLVGAMEMPEAAQRDVGSATQLVGPVPRREIGAHYAWADVFVFPSICEGSATVCYEALAAGLPVITTPNAGSVVRDGIDGFIVPTCNPEAIAEKLELLIKDRNLLTWMSTNALQRSRDFTIERYGERLIGALSSLMKQG